MKTPVRNLKTSVSLDTPMIEAKSSMVVILFTDLIDSTAWKRKLLDQVYTSDLRIPHDRIFRDLLRLYPGAVERDNAGDGFLATFATASDATEFALRFHRALATYAWSPAVLKERVPETRIGIHLGQVAEFQDEAGKKISGQAVDLTARVMSMGKGGYTLLTRHAFDSSRQHLKQNPVNRRVPISWVAHGRYRLKGNDDDPLEIFGVAPQGSSTLVAPSDTEKTRRVKDDELDEAGRWRPGVGLAVPNRENWIIQEQLGEGGFGEVWLGENKITQEKHVFKFCFDIERLRSFRREQTLFRLLKTEFDKQEDFVQLFDAHIESHPYFLESEFIPGGNLLDWIAKYEMKNWSTEERIRFIASTAKTVARAHSLGIIHKDLKPSNILVRETTHGIVPVLADFGIGVLLDATILQKRDITVVDGTKTVLGNDSSRTGTRLYAPPETIFGASASAQFDVYALGVLLYQALIGDFEKPLGIDWEETLPDRDSIATQLLASDIRDATRTKPEDRLKTVDAFADRLRTLPQRVEAHLAEQKSQKVAKVLKRTRRVLAASVACIIVLIAVAGTVAGLWLEAQRIAVRERSAKIAERELAKKAKEAADIQQRNADIQRRNAEEARENAAKEREVAKRETNAKLEILAAKVKVEEALSEEKKQKERADLAARLATEQRLRSDKLLYASNLRTAQLYTEQGMMERAHDLLVSCNLDYRDWEYDYCLAGLTRGQVTLPSAIPSEQAQEVSCISWNRSDDRIVSGGVDGKLRIWDAGTGKLLLELNEPGNAVRCVTWNSDGSQIASGSDDKTLRIWDAKNGKELTRIELDDSVDCAAWSDDGSKIVTGSSNSARIWNAQTGEQVLELPGHIGAVTSVAFSPDGKRVVSCSDNKSIKIFDASTGTTTLRIEQHDDRVNCLAWSNDGSRIISGSKDKTAKIWDSQTGRLLRSLIGHSGSVDTVAISPDCMWIATGSEDKTLRVWDLLTGQAVHSLVGHNGAIRSVAWSADCKRLVSASSDRTIKVWNATTGQDDPVLLGHINTVKSVAWSPDGKQLASCSDDKTVRIWDTISGNETSTFRNHKNSVNCVQWSPNGKWIASAGYDRSISIVSADSGEQKALLEGHARPVNSIAWSPDSSKIASGCSDSSLRIWSVSDGKTEKVLLGHDDAVNCVAWSPDGKFIVSAGSDGTLKTWDATTLECLKTLSDKDSSYAVNSVVWSPDSVHLASGGADGKIALWNASSGQLESKLSQASEIKCVAWSPNGKRLASGADDHSVRIWEVESGLELLTASIHNGEVYNLAWSTDGHRLATASSDKKVIIWNSEHTMLNHEPLALAEDNSHKLLLWSQWDPKWHKRLSRRYEDDAKSSRDPMLWYATAFHLKHMVAHDSDDEEIKSRLKNSLQQIQQSRAEQESRKD